MSLEAILTVEILTRLRFAVKGFTHPWISWNTVDTASVSFSILLLAAQCGEVCTLFLVPYSLSASEMHHGAQLSDSEGYHLKADRSLFGCIIVMAQGRDLKMENILSHPLGPIPWALSTPDGLLRKTNKASLATTLQKNVAVADQLP